MNTSVKILITGTLILMVGAIGYFVAPFIQEQILVKKEPIIESQNTEKNTQNKIPQKITNTAEKISGVFYINFLCPHCRNFYKNSFAPLRKEYKKNMDIQIKNYPFRESGLEMEMAKIFRCASKQKDQFFVLDYFFYGMDSIEEIKLDEWKKGLKLDSEKFDTCMKSVAETVQQEKKEGTEKGVKGTPTLFLSKGNIHHTFEGDIEKYKLEMSILPLIGK